MIVIKIKVDEEIYYVKSVSTDESQVTKDINEAKDYSDNLEYKNPDDKVFNNDLKHIQFFYGTNRVEVFDNSNQDKDGKN